MPSRRPAQLLPLSRAADEVRERAYEPLAPAAVKAAGSQILGLAV
ncbi:hypothetical protein [Kitasatospora purpeofusca]